MPQITRKRRAPTQNPETEETSDSDSDVVAPSSRRQAKQRPQPPPQSQSQGTRRTTSNPSTSQRRITNLNDYQNSDPESPQNTDTEPQYNGNDNERSETDTITTQSKLLIRLALSHETSRIPLRRTDINAKCSTTSATFRRVFDEAQMNLKRTFGMQLTELPSREKTGLRERQAAALASTQASASRSGVSGPGPGSGGNTQGTTNGNSASTEGRGSGGSGDKQWILTTSLPQKYRAALASVNCSVSGSLDPSVLSSSSTASATTITTFPSAAITSQTSQESSYLALVTFIITLITLSGGVLAETKLDRHLRRVNANTSTPLDSTDKVLVRMAKEGYITKTKEGPAGDEIFEYRVGPRGKVEVGEKGVGGLVRNVFGVPGSAVEGLGTAEAMGEEEAEELEKKIQRSLRIGIGGARSEAEG